MIRALRLSNCPSVVVTRHRYRPCPPAPLEEAAVKDQGVASTTVDASGGQGVQVGTDNLQQNFWTMETPLDPAALSALSPRRAVARIRQISHDAAVDFFARASSDDAGEILRGLLQSDEPRAISILADLNWRTAEQLIQPLTHDFPWLVDLPGAAEGIASHAAALELGDDRGSGQLERAAIAPGGRNGYLRTYEEHVIYWSEGTACAVSGKIAEYYATVGGCGGALGFPLSENEPSVESQHGANGTEQRFEGGIVCSSNLGTYAVSDRFNQAYQSVDGVKGWLGFPICTSEPYEDAKVQRFEGGIICSSAYGAFPVRKAVVECADGWLPVSNEVDAGKSAVSGRRGRMQRFRAISGGRIVVYSSDGAGIYRVGWQILNYYKAQGGPTSMLGMPVSEVAVVEKKGYFQMFEGGCIYSHLLSQAFMVPASTVDKLKRDSAVAERLGWPVSEEKPAEKSGIHIQRFENGIVTREDGGSEIWLRPWFAMIEIDGMG